MTSSKSIRLVNLLIDLIFIGIISGLITLIFKVQNTTACNYLTLLGYYLLWEYLLGKTPGKFFSNSKVVCLKTKHWFFWIFIRTILRFNPFDAASYLFGQHIGAHDIFSFTRVVDEENLINYKV